MGVSEVGGDKTMIKRYENLIDFLKDAEKAGSSGRHSSDWYGNLTWDQTVNKTRKGDDSLVPMAQELIDQLEQADIEVPHREWTPDVYGAYGIVPDALAGSPVPMRRLTMHPTEVAPINIYVSTTSSAGISADVMLKRGVTILALCMKLQQIRPVSLYLLAETHGKTDGEFLQVIKLDSQPIGLAIACFTLTAVGFARHLTYRNAEKIDSFNGAWPNRYASGGSSWVTHVKEVLCMTESDLYIGAARAWDDLVTKPVEWINAQIKKLIDTGDLEENER